MKIISLNCNGIRSAINKGLIDFLKKENPDICCFQEVKAEINQIPIELIENLNFRPIIFSAKKKRGYSGVGILLRDKTKEEIIGIDHELYDEEARSILVNFGKFTIWNVYVPSGTSGEERQKVKMEFLNYFLEKSNEYKKKYKNLILCGDFNIAHTPIDIHNPKGNEKNSGFLPEEREWMSEFIHSGFIDVFRSLYPTNIEYSWWTYRFQAKQQNKGWRIDYFFSSKSLFSKIQSLKILKEYNFSDHAPLVLEFNV